MRCALSIGACGTHASVGRYGAIPPQHKKALHEAIFDEILEERVVSSRNRIKRQRTRRLDVAKRIGIVK